MADLLASEDRWSWLERWGQAEWQVLYRLLQIALLCCCLWLALRVVQHESAPRVLPAPDAHWAVVSLQHSLEVYL